MHDRRARTAGDRSPAQASLFRLPAMVRRQNACGPSARGEFRTCSPGFVAWPARRRALVWLVTAIAPLACDVTCSAFPESSSQAEPLARSEAIDRFAKFIDEASGRFAIPARWIRAVMRIESDGDDHAVSPRGAMGLMQLMPDTWVELSIRNGLGVDPFDAHDNIIAGTAYLKELRDRFGSTGFLAAYHAGPARYEQHLATGRPLPQETIAYVAAVMPLLDGAQSEHAAANSRRALPWREAPLFVERAGAR